MATYTIDQNERAFQDKYVNMLIRLMRFDTLMLTLKRECLAFSEHLEADEANQIIKLFNQHERSYQNLNHAFKKIEELRLQSKNKPLIIKEN